MSLFPIAKDLPPLLASWGGLFWSIAAILLFFLGLVLVFVILIQDSQGGGLGGAFGGGGGESVLGARAQRGVTKFTAILGIIFGVTTLLLGKFNPDQELTLTGEDGTSLQEGAEAEDGTGMTTEPGDTLLDETEPETPETPEDDATAEDSAADGEKTIQEILGPAPSGDEGESGGEASGESPPDENDTSS